MSLAIESTKDLVSKSIIITDQVPAIQEDWLVQVGQHLMGWEAIEDGIIILQCEILYRIWSIWDSDHNDEHRFLSREATYRWQHDFYKWAKAYTKRRANKEQAVITIDNKIGTYRDWEAQGIIEHPEIVFIPRHDDFGQLINPDLTKEEAWEGVEFNFKDCDYGKLLVAKGVAKRGEMCPEAWSALRDPYATVQDLKNAIEGDRSKNKRDDDFYLLEEDGIIYGCEAGRRVPALQAVFEYAEDPLFQRTYCHILRAAGLKIPVSLQ